MTLVLRYAARSDVGLVRGNNEDSVYAGARLLALADGMGGHAAGEVASQLVIAALAPLDDDEAGGDLLSKLDAAVREGNSAIAAQVETEPELEGMGTTLTAILFAGDRLGLVHIGDSRGYLLRDGELSQITKDDTFVQTLVDEGRLTAEEAHSHPQRSLIMRALTGHEVEPALAMREARVGDRYLLCSDGLSDPVSEETILEALQISDVGDSALRLIELALRGGGPDNVTVVVADVVDGDYGQTLPILAGAVSGEDTPLTRPDTAAGRASAINPRKSVAQRTLPQIEAFTRQPRSRRRMIIAAALVVLLLLGGIAVGWHMIRNYYYVAEHDGTVSIMRGVQGSVLGLPLHQPYLAACLSDSDDLSLISYDQSREKLSCRLMKLQDLRQSAGAQVAAGLPAGTLDDAIEQLRHLTRDSLLPPCPPVPATPSPPTPQTAVRTPAPDVTRTPTSTTTSVPDESGRASPPSTTTTGVPHLPTVTVLPRHPPEPGTECRAAA